MVGHVQVVAICKVSVVLPAVSKCDLFVMLGACPEAVQDLCWEWVCMVLFFKQFLQGCVPISGRSVRQQTQVPLRLFPLFLSRPLVYHQRVLAASNFQP